MAQQNLQIEEEQIEEMPIPQNAEFDLNIGSYSFEIRRAAEGLILGVLVGTPVYLLLRYLSVSGMNLWIYSLAAAAGAFLIGNNGINGDSVSRYIMNVLRFSKKKRIAHYNPRIKFEKRFFTEETEDDDYVIPRERLEALYHKYVSKTNSENAHMNFEKEELDTSTMYFEDDIEVLGKPTELMSKSERRKYEKEKRKTIRKIEKEQRRKAKDEARQQKKERRKA
jgi:hypothetical protein